MEHLELQYELIRSILLTGCLTRCLEVGEWLR